MGSSEGKCAGQLKLTTQTHQTLRLSGQDPNKILVTPSAKQPEVLHVPVQNTHQTSILSADVSLFKASHSSVKTAGDWREKESTNQKEKSHSLRSH